MAKKNKPEKTDQAQEERPPIVERKTATDLFVDLTDEQMAVEAVALADKLQERSRVEDRKKAEMSAFKSQLDGINTEIDGIVSRISAGGQRQLVDCTIKLNFPEPGRKVMIRDDNGETVWEQKMEDIDRQMLLGDLDEDELRAYENDEKFGPVDDADPDDDEDGPPPMTEDEEEDPDEDDGNVIP
jgi:hypothetical protein